MNRLIFGISLFLTVFVCKAQVSLSLLVPSAGGLFSLMTSEQRNTVTDLTLTGVLDARDFVTLRDQMPVLTVLNLDNASILEYTGNGTFGNRTYPADEIPYCAFFNSSTHVGKASLAHISLPSTINAIGNYAFQDCSNLEEINIPEAVDTVRQAACHLCYGLNTVTIPAGVTFIDNEAFASIGGVILVSPDNPCYSSLEGVLFNKDQSLLIQCPDSKSSYEVPATVSVIGSEAFIGCTELTEIDIPETVISIQGHAFVNCQGLTSVELPASVSSISYATFMNCTSLQSVIIPNSIDSIGDIAFTYCSSLTHLDLPYSVKYIGMMAFWMCNNLVSVNLPASLETLMPFAFKQCPALESVIIPPSVVSVTTGVFAGCSGLKKVTLPSSITTIESNAFFGCSTMEEFHANNPQPVDLSGSANVFNGVPVSTCILYVPVGSKTLYENAPQWQDFENIVEDEYAGIQELESRLTITRICGGKIRISGLQPGNKLTFSFVNGIQLFSGYTGNESMEFFLPVNGIYILRYKGKPYKIFN